MLAFFEQNNKQHSRFPKLLLEIAAKYFRVEVEGLEHIPARGRALIVPNHSGFTALDAVITGHEIYSHRKRIPKILAHPLWFVGPHIRILAKKMGLAEASKEAGEKFLRRGELVMIFPEGAAGNFKPTASRYHLQEFKRGYVRMAMATKAPIIPVAIIGAEETNINLSTISLAKYFRGTIIPLPLNVIPLPAKWKIIFMPPILMDDYSKKNTADRELVHSINEGIRRSIQNKIKQELAKREWIYFPVPKS